MFSGLSNSLNFLVGPVMEVILMVGGGLIAAVVLWFGGSKSGERKAENKNLKRELKAKFANDEIIDRARAAHDDVNSDILRGDDPQNRSNW